MTRVILMPCIFVYKMLYYILKTIKNFINYFFSGFLTISFIVYKFFKFIIFGFSFPFVVIYRLIVGDEERRRIKEQKKYDKLLAKNRMKIELENKKEEANRKKIEEKEKKKAKTEEYLNEDVVIEKKTLGYYLNKLFLAIGSIPKKIVVFFQNKYNNSAFVRNAKNKRDASREALLLDLKGKDNERSEVKIMYEYVAKGEDGKVRKGYFDAFSKVEVHSFLLSEGYEVYSIKTNKWIQMLHTGSSTNKVKIKIKDLIFFLTQLSTYIKSGITLVDSLKILSRQYKKKTYQRIFRSIIYDLTMGEAFSDALIKQGEAFPKLLINMVKAAEMTGELPEALDDMANYYTETDKTRKQMITAMMYPSIIFILAMAVTTFILIYVVPKFVAIYETLDTAQIPKFTLWILSVSNFLQNKFILIVVVLFVVILVLRYLYKNVKSFRTIVQWLLMHLPIFGDVIIYNEVTMFTKTFASLLKHNVFIADSMEILNRVTNNEIYKMLIFDTITNLARGEKISYAFKDHWAFPLPAYEMLVTGEETGQLPEMMAKVSDYYQELHKNAVARIKTFIEPVLIIMLTTIVGTIVLSLVIPMFSMYQSIQAS